MVWWAPIAAAAVGGGLNWLASKSGGKKADKPKQLATMNPQQQKLLSDFLERAQGLGPSATQASSYFQNFLNPQSEQFRNFEAPYMRQFNEQTIPRLAEQFAGAGGGLGAQGGALSSSGFAQALGAAGAGLQEKLASLKSGLQYSAAGDLLSNYQRMAQTGLGQAPFAYQDRGPSSGTSFLTGLAQNLNPGSIEGIFNQVSGIGGSTGNRQGGVFNNPYAYANNARW